MIEELSENEYKNPGTLYPLLHNIESSGILEKEEKIVKRMKIKNRIKTI